MTTTIEKLRDMPVEQLLILSRELTQTTVPEDALIREVIKDTQLDSLSPGLAFIGLAGQLHVEMAKRIEAHREALKAIVQYTEEKYSKAVATNALNEGIKPETSTGEEIHSIHCPAYTTESYEKRGHIPGECTCKK